MHSRLVVVCCFGMRIPYRLRQSSRQNRTLPRKSKDHDSAGWGISFSPPHLTSDSSERTPNSPCSSIFVHPPSLLAQQHSHYRLTASLAVALSLHLQHSAKQYVIVIYVFYILFHPSIPYLQQPLLSPNSLLPLRNRGEGGNHTTR